MTTAIPPLGVCMVAHDPRYLAPLTRRVAQMQAMLGERVDCMALITASSPLRPATVHTSCDSAGLNVVDCSQVDDTYFDFSAYRKATEYFGARSHRGVLYVNDTLVPKHDSSHLRRAICDQLNKLRETEIKFPQLNGPYRKSEFSVGNGYADEFVATFLFHLNAPGMHLFTELLDELPRIHQVIESQRTDVANPALLRLCQIHATQIRDRYRSGGGVDDRLVRKLATAYCERELCVRIRAAGVVWFAASGLRGRLLVPLQAASSRWHRRWL
jgi:hypothetical protein